MIRRSATQLPCPPATAFDIYLRVEQWPDWLPSVTAVRRLDPGPLRVGARTWVQQPRLGAHVWVVTDLVPDRSFTWETRSPGVRTIGRHLVQPHPAGCLAIAELEHRGPLAPVVAALTGRLTDRYLQLETQRLEERCAQSDS